VVTAAASKPVPVIAAGNKPVTTTGLTPNAALVNTLQSNGVSCHLVAVGQQQKLPQQQQTPIRGSLTQAQQPQVNRKAVNVITKPVSSPAVITAATAGLATTTITLTAANNNLFLSPGICLVSAPAAAAAASVGAVTTSNSSFTLPLMSEDFTVSPAHPDDQHKIPFSMIMDDDVTCWSKK
jgi:hypothetical protein